MKVCPICQQCYEDSDALCLTDNTALVPSRPGTRQITEKYRLDRLLGRGGMGAVYSGTHLDLDRRIAIKLLLPDLTSDPDTLERFRREARAAARLNHPNVADTYDYGTLPDGGAYIVMELIDGQTLRQFMNAAGQLEFRDALTIAEQVATGVEAAHQQGIVHRDLKPSNIILTQDHMRRLQAKVVDFSVAKLKEGTTTGGAALTASGSLIGTPRYMSPEQCSGHGADVRSDIYSIGVILYEMLAGRAPFDAPTGTAIAIKHIQEQPPPLENFRRDVPATLARLVMQSLAKTPSARPQSALEFAEKIEEASSKLPSKQGEIFNSGAAAAGTPQDGEGKSGSQAKAQTREYGPDTGRAGEPTKEHSLQPSEADAEPSVQSYAVADAEPAVAGAQTIASSPSTGIRQDTVNSADNPPRQTMNTRETVIARRKRRRPTSLLTYVALAAALGAIGFGAIALWMAIRRTSPRQPAADAQETARREATGSAPTAQPSTSPATVNNNTNAQTLSDAGGSDANATRAHLQSSLEAWITATVNRDMDKLMNFYAPVLEIFYLERNASRAFVLKEKKRHFDQMSSIQLSASEPDIAFSNDGLTATMKFRKGWDFRGAQPSKGEVLQELRWKKTDAGWKIIVERDLQILK